MARRWGGFLPQNQDIKEQWGILEERQAQATDEIQSINGELGLEEADADEEDFEKPPRTSTFDSR